MALYFGTAAQGTDHYTSSQAAELNGAIVGPGVYLLERGDGLRASLVDANTVRISSGLMLVNGRHVGVEGHHDVTLENGAPGVSRIAKVVLRVTTGQVEGIEAKVYQGTPTAGEPDVPENEEASLWELGNVTEIPVCTVRIDGIVPEDPVMLLPEVTPSIETLMADIEAALAGKAPVAHSHGTEEIVNLAVTTDKLANGSVTSAKIADGTIATADLANASVTADKLAASSVQTAKIANGAVTLDKLAANSVNAAKIVDGSVGTAELANGSVTSAKIADGTIVNADIANSTIDFSKLNAAAQKRVTDLEAFRNSVSQRLWSGALANGGSVTISNLSSCKVIGLEFSNGGGEVFPVVVKSGETRFSGAQFVPENTYWDVNMWGGHIQVTGNVLKSVKCSISVMRSTGLSNPFSLIAGNAENITAVWRIL